MGPQNGAVDFLLDVCISKFRFLSIAKAIGQREVDVASVGFVIVPDVTVVAPVIHRDVLFRIAAEGVAYERFYSPIVVVPTDEPFIDGTAAYEVRLSDV